MIPNRPTKNIKDPKTGTNRLILIPAAITAGDISPTASIESNAPIIPTICPKKPQTKANKVIELINLIVFGTPSLLRKPFTIRINTKIKITNKGYIKKGPPSFKSEKNIIFRFKVIQDESKNKTTCKNKIAMT